MKHKAPNVKIVRGDYEDGITKMFETICFCRWNLSFISRFLAHLLFPLTIMLLNSNFKRTERF